MALFSRLVAMFTGRPVPADRATREPVRSTSLPVRTPVLVPRRSLPDELSTAPPQLAVSVTFSGPLGPTIPISDADVARAASPYAFVLTNELPAPKTADQWWEAATHKRRATEGSDKAFAWLTPFVPLEIAKLEQLRAAQSWGPHGAKNIAKELRALVREQRKAKQPYADLLQALYGACALAELSASLGFEGVQPHAMTQYVDIKELQDVRCNFATMGYGWMQSLGKTDVKWLIEAFGEPTANQSLDTKWPHIRRNAISRFCWSELHSSNKSAKSLRWPQQSMQEWLNQRVKSNLGYHRQWQEEVAARQERQATVASTLGAAWAATNAQFVVADLETTGLNAETDEVLEFAAVRVEPSGVIAAEFSMLVRVAKPIPPVITRITGITQAEVDRSGKPLVDAMNGFVSFIGTSPVFFHNAPFDVGFLKKAEANARQAFNNPVHDTLPLAREAWPSLRDHKLATLAEHVGASAPSHRGLTDAKAALAVLLAARERASPLHVVRKSETPDN